MRGYGFASVKARAGPQMQGRECRLNVIEYKGRRVYADLGAEKPIAAEKDNQRIVVEIKVFGTPSPMTELEKALGQYGIYRTFLRRTNPAHILHMAIPIDVYQSFFRKQPYRKSLLTTS